MHKRSTTLLLSFFPFIALLVSSAPLLTLRFPEGHDWLFELVRTSQFKSALMNGQFPPYWGEDLFRGFGSPIFLFYAPLYSFMFTVCPFLTASINTLANTSATLRFNRWVFPEWRCLLNGLSKDVNINSVGTFDVMIPSGSNHIEIRLLPPFVRRIGLWISFCSLVVWMITPFWLFINFYVQKMHSKTA